MIARFVDGRVVAGFRHPWQRKVLDYSNVDVEWDLKMLQEGQGVSPNVPLIRPELVRVPERVRGLLMLPHPFACSL